MPRRFVDHDLQEWTVLEDGAAIVRSDRLHAVSKVRGSLAPKSDPNGPAPMTDQELAHFTAQWSVKRKNEARYEHVCGYRWATSPHGSEVCVDMVRFGALLTTPGVTVWRAALPAQMPAPLIVRLGDEPIALIAPLED